MPAKILVVDDEPSFKSIINQKFRNKIRKKDLEFIFASNGLIALEQLQAEPDIDIILTDISMPEMDGITLLSTLSDINHPTLKTVIISASSDLALVRKAMNLGAFDFLTKPIDLEDLEITVNKTLNYVQRLKDALKLEHLIEAAQKLYDSEKRLEKFLETLPVGVFVVDADGKPFYTNQTAQNIFGKAIIAETTPEQIPEIYQLYLAKTEKFYPYEQQPIFQALKGENARVDNMEIRQGEKIIPVEVSASPIFDDSGKLIYAIATFQDITGRKKAEAERIQFTKQLELKNTELSKLNQSYSRFVPKQFLRFLGHESIVEVSLGESVQKKMSILFSDIRSFTTLSETMTLAENFKFINSYLSRMEPLITANYGFIDKYIGDAIMALFGRCPDDAVQGALEMLLELNKYNILRKGYNKSPIKIGIGINTGSLMLGTVGGINRMDTTVISDAVNLASRLQDLTKVYGASLIISQDTFFALKDYTKYNYRFLGQVKVKGKKDVVSLFEFFDADPPELIEFKRQTKTLFEQGVISYYSQQKERATQIFQRIINLNHQDKAVYFYLQDNDGKREVVE
ncbi:MAG: response regulator [Okeania sp. SIO2F4]|uniref:response regulator n=1 Tax=Okeania sp. SIO2F4 TaxID=2607790 RepID=UPI0014294F67|nr:adenylate/guanylate cyclase domain-containing protein [Okeania sp. SIO2F4]NES07727.1 response regulator [Okeania sp. SIO2F4]